MKPAKRIIFVSPHLDDAVLSCGGLIEHLSKSHRVEIWTVFSGAPWLPRKSQFVKWLHQICNVKNASQLIRLRTQEDRLASRTINASEKHFRFLDCAYRIDPFFRPLYKETCFVGPHRRDRALGRAIAKKIARDLNEDDVVFCPLALGNHVDHVVTRDAVNSLSFPNVYYYADIPYYMNPENRGSADIPKLQKIEARLKANSVDKWWEAICQYKSQLAMIDPDGKSLLSYINEFQQNPFRFFTKTPVDTDQLSAFDLHSPQHSEP